MSSEVAETPKEPETKMETGDNAETATPSASKDKESASTPASVDPTPATPASAAASNSKGPPSAVEFEPPVACVRRILKKTLPSSSNVGKDAVAAFARASGIFIIYLTACANDFARENRRQTITANDVLAAIKELEFDEFAPELTAFLENYRELEKNKKKVKAKAAAERAKEATGEEKTNATEETKADESNKTDADGDASMGQDEDDEDDDDEGGTTTEAATTEAGKNEGEDEGEEDAAREEGKAMEE